MPKHRTTGPSTAARSAGSGSSRSWFARWPNAPCGISCTGVVGLGAQRGGARLGVRDHRVHPAQQRAQRAPRPAAAAEHVVGREHARHAAGQQQPVQRLERQPLVVDDVEGGGRAARGQHAGHVLGQPQRTPGGGAAPVRRGAPVEVLTHAVAALGGRVAVGPAAGQQLHLGARPRQRRRQGVVVGRRVGRGINELNAHFQVAAFSLLHPRMTTQAIAGPPPTPSRVAPLPASGACVVQLGLRRPRGHINSKAATGGILAAGVQ